MVSGSLNGFKVGSNQVNFKGVLERHRGISRLILNVVLERVLEVSDGHLRGVSKKFQGGFRRILGTYFRRIQVLAGSV